MERRRLRKKKRELMECSCQGDETGRDPKHKYTFSHGKQEKCPFLKMLEADGSVDKICISGALVQMTRERLSGGLKNSNETFSSFSAV